MDSTMTYAIMYLEINLVAVALVGLIRIKTGGISKMVAQRNFAMAIDSQMAFFLSDTIYVMIKCGLIPYSRFAVTVSKSIYFFSCALMCYFWFIYFELLQDSWFIQSRSRVRAASALVWVMALLLIINPFNGILFYINDNEEYCRGPLFIVQYILAYSYVFISCTKALLSIPKTKSRSKRKKLAMLAVFPIAPAGAGILQFIYPHLPLACAALSIATLILYLNWVDELIAVDPLTKLSNRKMLSFFFNQWKHNENEPLDLYLMILDANKFKSINDTYGHIEGDAALMRIADAMNLGCMTHKKRTNLIRYGGDEFLMLIWTKDEESVRKLGENIQMHLTRLNKEANAPYDLTVSIGISKADRKRSLKEIIDEADDKLYEVKKNLR